MTKNILDIKKAVSDPATRQSGLLALGDWTIETCLLFGASVGTAYQVAALMVKGISHSYSQVDGENEG